MRNIILLLALFGSTLFYCQAGDNGFPFLYKKLFFGERNTERQEYKDASENVIQLSKLKNNIKTFEIEGFNNQEIINEVSQFTEKDSDYINQNIYGKNFNKEINITDDDNRIEYDGRYYHLYKITSPDAKALQIYFKKYFLTKDSKLFFYAENGFILGEFNDKNNPDSENKGLEFGIQPIPGNTFYIELSYPVGSTEKPSLVAEKIIHSFTEFYGGAYGTAGSCHKNIACVFTGTDDKSRNIKSVGLMLYPIYQSGTNTHTYSASCSGNLMNNTAQNGLPYFLTAAHCIGYEAANSNTNWNNELITLFNYEAKTCASNGSDAPSTLSNNSVLGCSLLTQSPSNANDYALIKLNVTASVLSQYKVCYAGWDNNPNSYMVNPTNSYGVHHPKGDTKKISFVDKLYPVISNQATLVSGLIGYFGVPWAQNPLGAFLQNSWRSGIVEKGSSGSPLFNSFDRLIGSLSTGPDPSKFNCDAPNIYDDIGPTFYTYYSRFSNNYYTMSPWLNPNGANVQSIGPYCPSTPLMIGAPIIVTYPQTGNPQQTTWEEEPRDINGEFVHPANTWGKKLYLQEFGGSGNYAQQIDMNFNYYRSVIPSNKTTFALSENIYDLYYNNITNYLSNLQLWGIYKIVDCNKVKYLKPAKITIKNPGTIGQVHDCVIDVVGLTDNKVHILIEEWRQNANGTYKTYELQSYKIVNNELVFESYKTLFSNQQNISIGKFYDFDNGHLMLSVYQNSVTKLYSCFYNEQNTAWLIDNTNPQTFGASGVFTKIVGNKVFMQAYGQNKLDIYNLASNSPTLTPRASLPNIFLTAPGTNGIYDPLSIFEKSPDVYNIIYKKTTGIGFYEMMQLDLSNNSANSFHISMPDDFKNMPTLGSANFIIRNNEIIKLSKLPLNTYGSEGPSFHYLNFKKDASGNWFKNKINFLKWYDVAGFNSQYVISSDYYYGYDTKRRMFSIREVDYLAHPYTMYDNQTTYSSAYHRPKKLDNYYFSEGIILYGKEVFKNLTGSNTNKFLFRAPNFGYDYNSVTYDVKTVILDNNTQTLTGNKNVSIYGKYSVIMKPGFKVSASTGLEFHAIPQAPLPNDVPACSLTFEDMLHPVTTQTPNETLYLKQAQGNQPYLGEIILGEISDNTVIDNNDIIIYPNPATTYIKIETGNRKLISWKLFDIAGRIALDGIKNHIDVQKMTKGAYVLSINTDDNKTISKKIIIK